MTDELVLYTNPTSRGRIVRWMLEEIGQPYQAEMIDYGPGTKSPEFLAINPMGKLPVLRHGEIIITEAAAICAYLADAFPNAGLAPPPHDPRRGAYYRWLFFAAGPVESAVTNKALGVAVPESRQRMVGYGTFATTMDVLEQAISAGDYLVGDQFTAADVYVGSQIGFGLQFNSIDRRPAFERYWARVSDRAAHRRATGIDDGLIAARL